MSETLQGSPTKRWFPSILPPQNTPKTHLDLARSWSMCCLLEKPLLVTVRLLGPVIAPHALGLGWHPRCCVAGHAVP